MSGLGSLLPSLFHLLTLPVARGQSRRSFWRLPRVVPRRGIRGVEACSSPGLTGSPSLEPGRSSQLMKAEGYFLRTVGHGLGLAKSRKFGSRKFMTRQGDHRASHCNTKVHQKTGRETEALYKAVKEKWLAFHRTEGNVSTYFIILVD